MNRNEKGYTFELMNCYELDQYNIVYISNPTNFERWKRVTKKDFDKLVFVPRLDAWVSVEEKLTLTKIYPSWFKRDWLSRNCDVYITNEKNHLTVEDRNMIGLLGRRLFTPQEFICWVLGIELDSSVSDNGNKSFDLNSVSLLVSELVNQQLIELDHSQQPIPTTKTKVDRPRRRLLRENSLEGSVVSVGLVVCSKSSDVFRHSEEVV